MANQAKYSMLVPKVDNLGNELVDIASAAHHYLFYGPMRIEGSFVERDKQGNWRDLDPEPHDMIVTYADDSPQMDSQMKQAAAYVADVANQWGIFVIKEDGKSINTWTVANPAFRPGEPAEQLALAQPESTMAPSGNPLGPPGTAAEGSGLPQ